MCRYLFPRTITFSRNILRCKRKEQNAVQYCSFYYEDMKKRTVSCEISGRFDLLEHNAIMDTFRQLYMDEIGVALE